MPDNGRRISSVALEGMSQRDGSIFFPVLLDIRHPGITWGDSDAEQQDGHLRVVNDTRGIKYKGNDAERRYYAPCSFTVKMPKEDGKQKSTASISISCVDQRVIEVIRLIDENLTCQIVAMYAKKKNEDGTVRYLFSKIYGKEFDMGGVQWDGLTAQWTLEPDRIMEMSVPRDKGSVFRNPAVMVE